MHQEKLPGCKYQPCLQGRCDDRGHIAGTDRKKLLLYFLPEYG